MKVITLDSPLKIGIKSIPMAERKNDNEALIKVHTLRNLENRYWCLTEH